MKLSIISTLLIVLTLGASLYVFRERIPLTRPTSSDVMVLTERFRRIESRLADLERKLEQYGNIAIQSPQTTCGTSDCELGVLRHLEAQVALITENLKGLEDTLEQQVRTTAGVSDIGFGEAAAQRTKDKALLMQGGKIGYTRGQIPGTRKLEEDFLNEVLDPNWSERMVSEITHAFNQPQTDAGALESVECRSTKCRVEYAVNTEDVSAMNMLDLELPALLSASLPNMTTLMLDGKKRVVIYSK